MAIEAILFDVFGTLVDYEPDLGRLPHPDCHELLGTWGHDLTHADFVARWEGSSAQLEAAALMSHDEYSMLDAARAFAATGGRPLSEGQLRELAATFLTEWMRHVRPVAGAAAMCHRLASSYRLAIVSNTHDPAMVPDLLRTFGMADAFELVVLSIDHGRRKPHHSIYEAALARLGVDAAQAAFVGDTVDPDFHGPEAVGIRAYLIDPGARHPVPADRRLPTLLDLEGRLSG